MPSPSHSQWRRTGRPRLSSSGPVSQRHRCVRGRWNDNEDSHQSCTVVMLLRIETDQIYHAVSAITRAKHSGHCSGSQPIRLLQCCLRWSSSLWHPTTTVSPQHSRTSGRRLIATRSRDFSATRSPLAAKNSASSTSCVQWYIAACTVTRHLTWRTSSCRRLLQLSDLVSDLPHPDQSQCHELYRRSETGPSRLLIHVHGTNFHHRFAAFTLLILLNVNLRHFYTITLLIYIAVNTGTPRLLDITYQVSVKPKNRPGRGTQKLR